MHLKLAKLTKVLHLTVVASALRRCRAAIEKETVRWETELHNALQHGDSAKHAIKAAEEEAERIIERGKDVADRIVKESEEWRQRAGGRFMAMTDKLHAAQQELLKLGSNGL